MNSSTSPSIKRRLQWADIAKGIGILAVIVGHLGVDSINRVVFTFHMPLFFLLAGYFFSQKPWKVFLPQKAKTLLQPYFFTGLLVIIGNVFYAIPNHQAFYAAKDWILGVLFANGSDVPSLLPVPSVGAIWFLWAMFWALLFLNLIANKPYTPILVLLLGFVSYLTAKQFWLPLDIQAGGFALLFVYAGYLCKQKQLFEKKQPLILFFVCLVFWLWCMIHFKGFWMVSNFCGNGILDIIGGFAGSYCIVYICKWIEQLAPLLSKILIFYGKNSLVVLCLHLLELNLFPWHLVLNPLSQYGIVGWKSTVLIIILKIALLTIATALCLRSKFLCRIFSVKRNLPNC